MTRARDFADLAGSASAGGLTGRNLIINGAMQVAQRGTSFTSTGYTLDRMQMLTANTDNVAFTTTQSTTAPDGFASSLKVDITTAESALAADELFRLLYKAEGQDLQQLNYGSSAATSVTLSFYVRSNVTGVYAVEFRLNAAGTSTITKQYTINSADTWERKTLTLPANTATAIDNDNTNGLEISFALAAGSNFTTGSLGTSWASTATASRYAGHAANVMSSTSNEWLITGIQMELGDSASPFEHRSFGDELARCQRYLYLLDATSDAGDENSIIFREGTTAAALTCHLPVNLRATPSIVGSNLGRVVGYTTSFGVATASVSALGVRTNINDGQKIDINITHASLAGTYVFAHYDRAASGAGILSFDAEL